MFSIYSEFSTDHAISAAPGQGHEERITVIGESETGYTEDCCFNYPRDQCRGRRCLCGCHVVADHPLQAFCAPATSCPMVHPCHIPGCTIPPEWHPDQSR